MIQAGEVGKYTWRCGEKEHCQGGDGHGVLRMLRSLLLTMSKNDSSKADAR